MSLSVSSSLSATQQTKNCSFKGSVKTTEKGNKYYHTNSAIKIGGALAGVAGLGMLLNLKNPKGTIASALLAIAAHLGISSFIDKKRNQKTEEITDSLQIIGQEKALNIYGDELAINKNGYLYHESNTGKKWGTRLGAIYGIIPAVQILLEKQANNSAANFPPLSGPQKLLASAFAIGVTALGGRLLGKWSDNIANKEMKKQLELNQSS